MAKNALAIVLVLVSMFFFGRGNVSGTKDMALIESVCKKTTDYKLCISTLKSNPRSFKTDVKGLARNMIGVIQGKLDGIIAVIDHLGKTVPDYRIRQCLNNVCSREYDTNRARMQEAIEDLESGSLVEAITDVQYALENEQTCEDCFDYPIKRKSPITHINSYFGALCNVTQDILVILEH